MNEFLEKMGLNITTSHEKDLTIVQKLFETARPTAVFGAPIQAGGYTVITASEVMAGGGVGYGGGGGAGSAGVEVNDQTPVETSAGDEAAPSEGYGVGGGGGGYTWARPVAAIMIGPEGIRVDPIVDATKVAIALFTTIGAMALMFARMNKLSHR